MLQRLSHTAHIVALSVWLGAIVMAGVVAAIVFPTMRGLDPRLPEFGSYDGAHWRIAAGQVAAKVFFAADAIQYVCAGVVVAALVGLWLTHRAGAGAGGVGGRTVFALVALGLLGYHALVLTPRMRPNMTGYWAAAKAGDNATAERLHGAFDRDHPTATRVLVATAMTLLASLGVSAWSAGAGRGTPNRDQEP